MYFLQQTCKVIRGGFRLSRRAFFTQQETQAQAQAAAAMFVSRPRQSKEAARDELRRNVYGNRNRKRECVSCACFSFPCFGSFISSRLCDHHSILACVYVPEQYSWESALQFESCRMCWRSPRRAARVSAGSEWDRRLSMSLSAYT